MWQICKRYAHNGKNDIALDGCGIFEYEHYFKTRVWKYHTVSKADEKNAKSLPWDTSHQSMRFILVLISWML